MVHYCHFDHLGESIVEGKPEHTRDSTRESRDATRTHVYEVGQVVGEVLVYGGVGRVQTQQVLVARLQRLQLVVCVLGLFL